MEQNKKKSLREKYPEIYAQTNIDRKDCVRVVPMEVLSLGMGRTGTMCEFSLSLYSTLYSFSSFSFFLPPDFDFWILDVWSACFFEFDDGERSDTRSNIEGGCNVGNTLDPI
jgi:hypothetical protein